MGKRNPELRAEGRAAAAKGLKRFLPSQGGCTKHPGAMHYTSSGRCVECTRTAKTAEDHAAYWAAHGEAINARRRAAYADGETSIKGR